MLVLTRGGKERTRAELQTLLSAAGFRVSRNHSYRFIRLGD